MPVTSDNNNAVIVINSSSPVIDSVSQEEFNFKSNAYTSTGLPLNKTNFIEYNVELPAGTTVSFFRKVNVKNISSEIEMSYKTDIHTPVVISESTGGLALNNIAFTGSIVFKASTQLLGAQEIKIYLLWQ